MEKRIISFLLSFAMIIGLISPTSVLAQTGAEIEKGGDVAGDWPMPVEGTYDLKGHLKKMHIQYDGVGENTMEFSIQFQSTVSPPGINHVDFRVDPRIKEYITKVEGKGKGALSLGESYVGFKDRNAAPGAHNKNVYRAKLDGPNGLFTALPWGAQVYEAKIIVHLNRKVSELKDLFPDRHYTFETRAVGTEGGKIDGEIIKIDKNSLNSATFVKFDDQVFTEDSSRWLRSNSTALVEYESGGTLTTNKDNARSGAGRERVPFGQGVMRIKYYIYPHMMIWDSYNALIDQYKHYSFELDIDPKLKDLIPDDAKMRVNALRLYGGAYNHVELPKAYINADNQLRISIYGTEKRNNEDKNVNQVVDPLVTKHNMYISADADGSLPTYLQIEIPIDETKAEENFDYNQYNFQGFYYNRRGQLVKNSLARTFTNAAKTDQMPGITAEGTALLWGDEVKGNSEYPGSEIFLVSNPDLDPQGNGIPGTGKVIGQMKTENKDFVIKTFAKDSQAYDPNNPNLFKDIINPATSAPYKAGEKVYVFQAKPGRMMSKGVPVTLIEEQTNKPEVEPVYAKEKIRVNGAAGILGERYFKTVSGSIEKIHQESPIDVKMIWHGDGAKLVNPGTDQEAVSGGKQKGTYTAQKVPKGETVEQTGDKPHFIINFDGTFSYYEEVGGIVSSNESKTFQVGDIIEVIATEEHCKESIHTYYVIGEEAPKAVSRKPQVGILYPTLPDTSEANKQIDSNFNKPNKDGDKSFKIRVQGGAKWRVEYFPAGATTPVEITGQETHGGRPNQWFNVYPQLPESGLQPGDVVKVYQKKKLGWTQNWANESVATTTIVQQHPEEYFGYTIEVYLEGKEGPQETIYVHKDGQIYPNDPEIGAAILNYIQADAPELPFPYRLKDELMRPDRMAHNYVYNQEKSTKFPITVTRDYKAFWENLGVSVDAANKASFKQNVFELHFDRDASRWADLLVDSGIHGHFTKASLVASDEHVDVFMEETEGKVETFAVKGIETNVIDDKSPVNAQGIKQPRNLTWAEIKTDKGIENVNITPIANPGYKFTKYIDPDSETDYVLEDLTEIGRSTNIVAQYEVDENQQFAYEVQYVYMDGEEEKPVPGKEAVDGVAPVETVISINQDPVDGYKVSADQPKEFTVEYVEENGNNNDATSIEPSMKQIVKVLYEPSVSEKPVITTDPVMDTTELVEGTSAPYAGIKLYYAKNIAAEGEPEHWVANIESPVLGETTTNKDGNWSVKVSGLTAGEKIIAVAKDPLKAEISSDPEDVVEDTNKFDGSIKIEENPAPKNDDQVVSGKINITPKPGEESPSLDGVVVEVFAIDPETGVETLIGKSIANAEGNFDVAVNPKLIAGQKIIAKAQPKKSNLMTGEAIVAIDLERLNKDIIEGDEFLAREDIGNFDAKKVEDLQKAVDAGKALKDAEGNPVIGATQDDINTAAQAIEDALKALNVNTAPFIDASDKVLDVGDVFDPLAGVTVKDAQEVIANEKIQVVSNVPVKSDTDNTTTTVGTYEVVYTVADSGGLETTKTVSVIVRENDKAALKVAIVKGENILADGKQYEPEQVKALEDAIAAGKVVDANPNATKTEIQEAKDAINTALTAITGNVQASVAPTIDKVRDGDVLVNGKLVDAENNPIADAEITITDKATGKVLGIAKTDATGTYSVSVPALKDTQVIQAVAREEGKNPSAVVEATVVPNTDKLTETIGKADDYVANNPLDPTDPIDKTLQDALDKAKEVKENAEKVPPTATQDQVDQAQKDLEDALNAKKEKDTAETNVPKINELKNGEKAVTGTAVPGSTVTVTMPDGATYTGKSDATTGEYNIPTRPLVGGEVVKVTATVDGVESNPAEATVVTDVAKLKDAITKGETAAEGLDPNTTDPEDKELLDAIAAGKDILVDPTDPNSAAKPGKTQKEADDAADRILAAIKAKEEADENDANSVQTPNPTVEPVSNGATTVSGTAEKGATVTVTMPDGATYTTTADGPNGEFSVTTRKLVGGEVINVTAKLPKRPVSEDVPVTVITDVNDLKAAIGEGETAMENANTPPTAEDTALQTAIDEGKALIVDPAAEPPVAKDGVTQKQADDAAQKIRDAIKAKEIADENNANSVPTPAPSKINPVANGDKVVTGTAEPGSTVTVYLPDGTKAEGKADETTGEFSIPTRPLKGNEVINVTAKLPKRPESEKVAVTVGAKVADAPIINDIAHLDTVIKGTAPTAKAGDEVVVTIDDSVSVKTTVKADGTWEATAPATLQSGQVVKAVVVPADKTIDKSAPAEKVVGLNTTGLQESYDKADPIVNNPDKPLDPNSNTDNALKEAFNKAKEVLDNANSDNPTVTQDEIDAAKKALDDALAEKEKFEDAKTAVDTAKTTPSKETIADAQAKIDAMKDGDDKDKLQKELDKIKLEEAIKKGTEKLKEENLDPAYKKELEDAVNKAQKDLDALKDADPSNDPTTTVVDADVKKIEDLVNNGINKTLPPEVNGVVKGTESVTGKAEPNADVTIVTPFETATVKANAEGNFSYTSPETFIDKQEVTVTAKAPGKTVSDPVKVIVGVDKSELEQAIIDGNQALVDNPNTPPTNADNKLKDAIENGETVKNDPNATQEQVDEATQKIKEAIDQKAAEDAVKALEDKQAANDPLNPITPEEIQDAQDKIDKLPGSIEDPLSPDFNQDKKDLQDRLDKIVIVEKLKDLTEKAEDRLNDPDIPEKPEEVVGQLTDAKDQGNTVIDKGDQATDAEIEEAIQDLEKALEDIEKEYVNISMEAPRAGAKGLRIKTRPAHATIIIMIDNVEVATLKTDGFGNASVATESLSSGQKITIMGSHPDCLENKVFVKVK